MSSGEDKQLKLPPIGRIPYTSDNNTSSSQRSSSASSQSMGSDCNSTSRAGSCIPRPPAQSQQNTVFQRTKTTMKRSNPSKTEKRPITNRTSSGLRPISSRPTTSSKRPLSGSTLDAVSIVKGYLEVIVMPLTAEKLKSILANTELGNVTDLSLSIDLRFSSFYGLTDWIPKLENLRLGPNSFISGIRDLGTGYFHLTSLSLPKCHLRDLDGISGLSNLKELYVPFNEITKLLDTWQLDKLEILDLDGNFIDSLEEIEFLALSASLRSLHLAENPITNHLKSLMSELNRHLDSPIIHPPSSLYRNLIFYLIPQLESLDEALIEEKDRIIELEVLDKYKCLAKETPVQLRSSAIDELGFETLLIDKSSQGSSTSTGMNVHGNAAYALYRLKHRN